MLFKKTGLVLGLIVPLMILVFFDIGNSSQTNAMAAIAIMMSIFWISEAIPLAATALLPLALLPLLGIASSKAVASQYMNSTVFLLVGGFMIALAMQRWQLHKRIALTVLQQFGGHPSLVLLGFMIATASLSMWISNTATTLMMLPIALAILVRYQPLLSPQQSQRFSIALLLSIAYSASIGGMMTLVGTAPNLVFSRFYENLTGISVGFSQWMLIALPVGFGMLLLLALFMMGFYVRNLPKTDDLKQVVIEEKQQLGKMRFEEKAVLVVFILTALLWVSRKGLHIGDFSITGWGSQLRFGKFIDDGSVAIFMALILFFIPARLADGTKTTLLDNAVFKELPWSLVLLFGGGFALAFGFVESGLSNYLALQLNGLKEANLAVVIVSVTAGMSLLTELTSNTATTQLVLPILQSTAEVIDVPAILLMLPATLAASCAFMFPVATPPNAIIFGSGHLKVMDMVKVGVILNILAIGVISTVCYFWLPVVFKL